DQMKLKGNGMLSTRASRCGPLLCWLLIHALALPAIAQQPPDDATENRRPNRPAQRDRSESDRPGAETKKGLILSTDAAFSGYTLFAPQRSTTTYLVDMKGEVTHSWPSKYTPGEAVYLLDDGSLLRCERQPNQHHFRGGGLGGRVERIAPDGKVTWEFVYAN